MHFSFTQTAANKAYVSVVCFFIIISLVGVVDSLSLASTFLMGIVPFYIAASSAIIAFLLILAFYLKIPPKLQRYSSTVTAIGVLLFIYLQLGFWRLIDAPDVFWLENPVSMSLITMMILMLFLGFYLRLRYPALTLDIAHSTLVICVLIVVTGSLVWYSLSYRTLAVATENARIKIHLVGSMINKRLDDQTKALDRIKARLAEVDEEDFLAVTQVDMQRYVADYKVIEGMILFDEQLNPLSLSPFAQKFEAAGLLTSSSTQSWLATKSSSVRLAANASSLATTTPVIMVSVPLERPTGAYFQLLALLNMNELISTEYLTYLSSVRTYLEFNPDLLVAMQGTAEPQSTLTELEQKYRHSITEIVTLTNSIDHKFHSFLADYSELEEEAKLNQLLLWLTIAFAFVYIVAADNTKRLLAESSKLAHMARYDDVTGLLRRDAFNSQIEYLRMGCEGCHRAVIFLNLDAFNSINKSLGHELGDRVLSTIAQRITKSAKNCDVIARFSNDEFILYYRDATAYELKQDAKAVLSSIAEVYKINGVELHLTASAGIAITSKAVVEGKTLVQQADIAMNMAKQNGGNQFLIYQSTMADEREQMVTIRNRLQSALNKRELEVFYQPIFSADGQRILSVESLVRWRTAAGFISPGIFIPIAEKTGQIIQLGEQVIELVLRDISQHEVLQSLGVAVNISPQHLMRTNFVEALKGQLEQYAVVPQQLTLELTETVMSHGGHTEQILQTLRDMGFHIAIDDFGTGFSSLSYLTRQPADIIKIDRAFTHGVDTEGKERSLLSMMVQICKQLDKLVVIEGVETKEQVELFTRVGCDRLQGFYLGKPMPLAELLPLLERQQHHDGP